MFQLYVERKLLIINVIKVYALVFNSVRNVGQITQYTKQQTDALHVRRKLLMEPKMCAQNGGE